MEVQPPTLAPSLFDVHRERSRKVVGLAFAVGVLLFGYGVGAFVVGATPTGWGTTALLQTGLLALGGLLLGLMALTTVWFSHQEQPRPLPRWAMLTVGLGAPFISTAVLVVAHWWRVGDLAVQFPYLEWVFLGQAVLGLQLYVGAIEPADRRRRLFVAEATVVFLVVFAGLVRTSPVVDVPALESFAVAGVVAAAVFLLVGGPLYLFGNYVVLRPR